MKKYLVWTRTNTAPKNRLQRAISEMLEEENRKVVSHDKLHVYVERLNYHIAVINAENPRCTPIEEVHIFDWDMEKSLKEGISDINISTGAGQFSIMLYQLRE